MKKPLQILFLVIGGSLAAGVLFVLLSPVAPRPAPPPPRPPAVRAALILDSSPSAPSQRTGRGEFVLGEKIYATVLLSGVEPGDHVLTFRWYNPRGGLQEAFRKPFSSRGGDYRAWSWLELKGEEWLGLPLGPLGPGRFLGRWRVEGELDGAFLARADFSVR